MGHVITHEQGFSAGEVARPATRVAADLYLRAHSVGSVVRSAFRLYGRHLGSLLLVYAAPTVPFGVWYGVAYSQRSPGQTVIAGLSACIATLFAYGALVVVVSDVTIGERPSASRAYRRMSGGLALRLLGTNLLSITITVGAVIAGAIATVVLGQVLGDGAEIMAAVLVFLLFFALILRYAFVPIAVVLERTTGPAALRRSRDLGRGRNLRNLAALLLVVTPAYAVAAIIVTAVLLYEGGESAAVVMQVLEAVLTGVVLQPLALITFVLLYYDLRVRKEDYDVRTLAQDLRR